MRIKPEQFIEMIRQLNIEGGAFVYSNNGYDDYISWSNIEIWNNYWEPFETLDEVRDYVTMRRDEIISK